MPGTLSDLTTIDGTLDFSGGVDSNLVTTIQSQLNENGMPRNMLPWLVNATIRNGGIRPRSGWQPLGIINPNPQFYQGGFLYEPEFERPYPVFLMGGFLYAVMDVDNASVVVDLSTTFGLYMPSNVQQAFFCQAEEFLVIQAGDYMTKPLFWDGTTLRRSNGIISPAAIPPAAPPYNEIPPGGPMCYYMGRLWYDQDGRTYAAGDIVDDHSSGTVAYKYRDSVLKVTENPLAFGGDGFTIPSQAGNIRAIQYAANINVQLGEGTLYIFTRKQIYSLTVPVTRTDWIGANAANMPLQVAAQVNNGSVNDRSVVPVNGDLFFQTLQPSIQSLQASVRNFGQWGQVPISVNEDRILAFNDRSLLWAASGIYFDNRLLQTSIPVMTPYGVVHQALVPLNFDAISTLNRQLPPAWEGMHAGLDHLQLFTGDYGGRERAFSMAISRENQSLELWELTVASHTENGDNRIDWVIEFPAFTWGKEFQLKELMALELWMDDIRGTVEFDVEYRPDSDTCWYPWQQFKVCAARSSAEVLSPTTPYPTPCGPGYKSTITLPHPPIKCSAFTGRPGFIAYQFQPRITVKGWCRIRGVFLHSAERDRQLYQGKVC